MLTARTTSTSVARRRSRSIGGTRAGAARARPPQAPRDCHRRRAHRRRAGGGPVERCRASRWPVAKRRHRGQRAVGIAAECQCAVEVHHVPGGGGAVRRRRRRRWRIPYPLQPSSGQRTFMCLRLRRRRPSLRVLRFVAMSAVLLAGAFFALLTIRLVVFPRRCTPRRHRAGWRSDRPIRGDRQLRHRLGRLESKSPCAAFACAQKTTARGVARAARRPGRRVDFAAALRAAVKELLINGPRLAVRCDWRGGCVLLASSARATTLATIPPSRIGLMRQLRWSYATRSSRGTTNPEALTAARRRLPRQRFAPSGRADRRSADRPRPLSFAPT